MVARLFIPVLFLMLFGFCGCRGTAQAVEKKAPKKADEPRDTVVYIPESKLPSKVLVLPPVALQGVKMDREFSLMLRGTLQNYLAAKGYKVLYADRPPAYLKKVRIKDKKLDYRSLLERAHADGLFVIYVHSFSGVNVVFLKHYKLDAELCLYNKEGKLGCWRDCVTRRRISIATDPLSAAAQVLGSVLSDTSTTKKKTLIMEWSYNVSALVPGFSAYEKKPKIFRVITNVSKRTFRLGDRIVVAAEGDPGMDASFDIGTFRRNLRMVETSKPGIYQGVYTVQKGDEATNQYILVRLANPRGDVSQWLDLEPPVNIDGVPPKPPRDIRYEASSSGVRLSWRCSDGTVVSFRVERSTKPLSGYGKLADVADFSFVDTSVKPGGTYYYRILSVDAVGNTSPPRQVGPVRVPVEGASLNGTAVGALSPGSYTVLGTVEVPAGRRALFGEGVRLLFSRNATLRVCGTLVLSGVLSASNGTWGGIEVCPGGRLEVKGVPLSGMRSLVVRGEAVIEGSRIEGIGGGVEVKEGGELTLERCRIRGMKRALSVLDGEVRAAGTAFEKNRVAVLVKGGSALFENCTFMDNGVNIRCESGHVLVRASYLGADDPADFRLEGGVKVVSYLTMPYPDGKVVEFNPEELEKRARKLLDEGVGYVKKGNYGRALALLERAYRIRKSRYVYYWLAYVYTLMGEDEKLSKIISEAMERYPYEVSIYQIAIRYYIFKGKYDEAESLLNRALKLQPNNPTLESMRGLLESMKREKKEEGGVKK